MELDVDTVGVRELEPEGDSDAVAEGVIVGEPVSEPLGEPVAVREKGGEAVPLGDHDCVGEPVELGVGE